jgi:hypothetical protein
MVDDKLHISLRRIRGVHKRHKPRGVSPLPQRENIKHGNEIRQNIRAIRQQFDEKHFVTSSVIDPVEVIRLSVDRKINEQELSRNGLYLLDEDDKGQLIVLSKDHLQEIERRAEEYSQSTSAEKRTPIYNSFFASLTGEFWIRTSYERTGSKLRKITIDDDLSYRLDVELWVMEDKAENKRRIEQFQSFVEGSGGRISDSYTTADLILFRIFILETIWKGQLLRTSCPFP